MRQGPGAQPAVAERFVEDDIVAAMNALMPLESMNVAPRKTATIRGAAAPSGGSRASCTRGHGLLCRPATPTETGGNRCTGSWPSSTQIQIGRMFSAWGPFWPWVTSNSTFCPSCSSR